MIILHEEGLLVTSKLSLLKYALPAFERLTGTTTNMRIKFIPMSIGQTHSIQYNIKTKNHTSTPDTDLFNSHSRLQAL
jgi:hypothetical protein